MAFWITLARSFFAMILGIALIFWPDKSLPMLGNFIGGFWIAGSLLSIRWGFTHDRSKALTLIVGAIGIIAGLALIGRFLIDRVVSAETLFVFIGIVAVLTGILHIDGRIPVRQRVKFQRTRSGLILGIFEIVLGLVLIFTPWQDRSLINVVAFAWAIIGSIVLFTDALAIRREARQEEQADL